MEILVSGQNLELLPEKAIFWKEKEALILSDLHLGKATFFQQKGIAVPEIPLQEDLKRLCTLIEKKRPKLCIIVGDLIHSGSELTFENKKLIEKSLFSFGMEVHLIFGNHDKYFVKNLPKDWNCISHHHDWIFFSFCFSHFPKKVTGLSVISGHLHPCYTLIGPADSLRLPCFVVQKNLIILPAFSSFVGHSNVSKTEDMQIYLIADKKIISL